MSILFRLRQARFVRILLVYLGAAWVVLEVADMLQEALALPAWIVPVAIVLLLVGLVVVGATAWVQANPATSRAEAAGEVPKDWELDLPDLARTLRRGRLPHLTWGRAVAGGVAAFLVLFGLAALLVPRMGGPRLGARDLSASEAAPGLAVLPFRATGAELETWKEGMVDLLSRNLDGLGGLRAIDSRTVLARWRETAEGDPDLATALAAARRTGAQWALVGSVVDVGSRVRVTADVHEVATGRRLEGVRTEGPRDSLLSLVDALSVDVAGILLAEAKPDLSRLRLASITTESPAALNAFVEGEAAFSRSRFEEALEAYQRAVDLDPGFALAHYRIGSARGWSSMAGADSARQKAFEHRDRLPAREALVVEAEYRFRRGALPSGVALLQEGVRRYPDDPELWYQLGDAYLHYPGQLMVSTDDAEKAFLRAVELDPEFAPYHLHLVDLALIRGDSAQAVRRLETERRLTGQDNIQLRGRQLQFDYLYGSEADRARVVAELEDMDPLLRQRVRSIWSLDGDKAGEALQLGVRTCEATYRDSGTVNAATWFTCLWFHVASGQIEKARQWTDAAARAPGASVFMNLVLRQTGIDPSAPPAPPVSVPARREDFETLVAPELVMTAVLAVEQGRDPVADSIARILERSAGEHEAAGDTLDARLIRGLAAGVEGYRALAAGRETEAVDRLQTAANLLAGSIGPEAAFRTLMVWPLAELYGSQGRVREAMRLYESLSLTLHGPAALLRRADLHESLGEIERARALRRHFLSLWAHGDTEHPMIAAARRGLPPG